MIMTRRCAAAVLATALLVGCGDDTPTGPADPAADAQAGPEAGRATGGELSARAPLDVSGDWLWTRSEILTVPADFAFVFGIEPEGPVTHFRCELEGVLTLDQAGATLSGVEMETDSRCETRGGQVFTQPGLGALIPIPEGRIADRSVRLVVGDPVLFCPIQARVEEIEAGRAISMRGTGRCIIPGHPKSDAPQGSPLDLDPPPAGTEKIVAWVATRP